MMKMKEIQLPEESRIFTKAELKILKERLAGSKKDPHSLYASRVKPKIIELLKWFKIRRILQKLVEPREKAGKRKIPKD